MSAAPPPPITWNPTQEQQHASRLWDFMAWLREHRGLDFRTYRDLWAWSATDLSAFWDSVREYFGVLGDGFQGPALAEEKMPGAVWYPQARVNFAENVLRFARDPGQAHRPALICIGEDNAIDETTWAELEERVAAVAAQLAGLGVRAGDRVAAVLPNIPEAIVGLLAAASIGAVWTISSPDLAPEATLERLRQLAPKVLIGADGYRFNGRDIDSLPGLAQIEAGLPSVEATLLVRALGTAQAPRSWTELATGASDAPVRYERLPFDHPLWVLFSSGTTGSPKGIVHGHGGMTLEALKSSGLNQDMGPADRYYVAANTSWMVWNTLVNTLMAGAAVVVYPGSPTLGRKDRQFEVLARTKATMFAAGAAYLALVEKAGLEPGRDWDLAPLRSIMSTGSPLPESTWRWVHTHAKADVHLGSDSGGTDICSGFIGSNPLEPVRLGELQGPHLGVAVEARSADGARVVGEVGEMVIRRPMPSMPLFFWGDDDGTKYRSAYFAAQPGVWTHGDWITETERGSFLVHGRSDATLNRAGVRLGSADIYAALQQVPEVRDSLVIGVELPDGAYWMPLFVALRDGAALTDGLRDRIAAAIRSHASARHVPDEVIAAPDIPLTHAMKKVEVPIKRLFTGREAREALSPEALANPESLAWFIDQAKEFRARATCTRSGAQA